VPVANGARITQFGDREMLWFINEAAETEADQDGWVTTKTISEHMGRVFSAKNPANNVGGRCSHMAKMGLLEKTRFKGEMWWKLTRRGEEYRTGQLRAGVETTLRNLPEGALLDVMRLVTRRSMRDDTARLVIRREYTYTEAQTRRR
jgi:hypothetical protein